MSGRWVDTMKTPTVWRSKYTARVYGEPQSDEGCFAATATIQGIRMFLARCLDKGGQGHEAFLADYTQAFLNAEVCEGEQLYAQPPKGWNTKNFCRTADVWCGRCARPCAACEHLRGAWQEHLSNKLKEHGFIQDERDPCLCSEYAELDICIGVRVDDMLAVGPSGVNEKNVAGTSRRTWQCVEVW